MKSLIYSFFSTTTFCFPFSCLAYWHELTTHSITSARPKTYSRVIICFFHDGLDNDVFWTIKLRGKFSANHQTKRDHRDFRSLKIDRQTHGDNLFWLHCHTVRNSLNWKQSTWQQRRRTFLRTSHELAQIFRQNIDVNEWKEKLKKCWSNLRQINLKSIPGYVNSLPIISFINCPGYLKNNFTKDHRKSLRLIKKQRLESVRLWGMCVWERHFLINCSLITNIVFFFFHCQTH